MGFDHRARGIDRPDVGLDRGDLGTRRHHLDHRDTRQIDDLAHQFALCPLEEPAFFGIADHLFELLFATIVVEFRVVTRLRLRDALVRARQGTHDPAEECVDHAQERRGGRQE
ncbi:MAG: hypothetical protein HC882_07545, partial [Acidobacteria bacterium]|nr:hypothetical protein [Acidobacteriota bacterium]